MENCKLRNQAPEDTPRITIKPAICPAHFPIQVAIGTISSFVFAVKERQFLIAKENKEELPELNAVISAEQVI
jgi:hypothetical protein